MTSPGAESPTDSSKPVGIGDDPYYRGDRLDLLLFVEGPLSRVLDVGCGTGGFGALLAQKFGCETWGIEFNDEAAKLASAKLNHVLAGDVADLIGTLPDGAFDLMAFNDVLEHLPEPGQVLSAAMSKLAPGGRLLASLPNIRYFRALKTIIGSGDFPWEDDGIFDRTHLRFFTLKSARRMFEASGYRVEVLRGINPASGFKLSLAVALSLGKLTDIRYLQIAVLAKPA